MIAMVRGVEQAPNLCSRGPLYRCADPLVADAALRCENDPNLRDAGVPDGSSPDGETIGRDTHVVNHAAGKKTGS